MEQIYWFPKKDEPQSLNKINPPATSEQIEEARKTLGKYFHQDLEELYKQANGFQKNALLLRDDYRILPIEEMMKESIGQIIIEDQEAGIVKKLTKLKYII